MSLVDKETFQFLEPFYIYMIVNFSRKEHVEGVTYTTTFLSKFFDLSQTPNLS